MSDRPTSDTTKAQQAKQAMLRRSRKQEGSMTQYYLVIGAFVAICVAAVIYVLMNPKQSFSTMPVIDESQILVHNGQQFQYLQGTNSYFQNWTLSDAKSLFQNSLSDTPNLGPCKTKDDEETIIPDKYDWREQYPECVQPVKNIGNCSSSYAVAPLSAISDRICQSQKRTVSLSSQEIINCDKNNYGCNGGYVNRALNFGKRKGFIPEECEPYQGVKGECGEEHFDTNECRENSNFYKVIDYCLASEDVGIKKEILKNGPVIAQMIVYTDFLTYKEGIYHRTEDAFKFNGQHIVKMVGWERNTDGNEYWIIENLWGEDWGEKGYARINGQDKSTMIDFFAIGVATYPMTMAEYYSMQEQYQASQNENVEEEPVEEAIDAEAAKKTSTV